jgi:hypothetical protein
MLGSSLCGGDNMRLQVLACYFIPTAQYYIRISLKHSLFKERSRFDKFFFYPPSFFLTRLFSRVIFNDGFSKLLLGGPFNFSEAGENQPSVRFEKIRKLGGCGASIVEKVVYDFVVDFVDAKGVGIHVPPFVGEDL